MIFVSVASAMSISSTMRLCRATRIRSDRARISGKYEEMTTTAMPSSASWLMNRWISTVDE